MESADREGEIPVLVSDLSKCGILSTTGHEKSCRKQAGPAAKAKDRRVSDREKYREVEVKRAAQSEGKRY